MADWLDEVHSGNELVGPGWQRALGALNDFGIKEADLIDLQQILDGVEELLEGLHIPPRQKAFILNAWPTRKFFIEELRQRAVATNRILSRMSWIPPISNREYEQFLAMGYMSDAGVPEESEPIRPESPTDDQLPIHGRAHQPDPTQGYCPVCPGSLSFQTWNTNSSWLWATRRTKASQRRLIPLVRLHWRMISSPFRTGFTRPLQRKAFRPNRRSLRRPRRRARSSRRQWFLQICWIFPSSSAFNAVNEPIYTIRENLEIPPNFWDFVPQVETKKFVPAKGRRYAIHREAEPELTGDDVEDLRNYVQYAIGKPLMYELQINELQTSCKSLFEKED